MKVGDLVRAVRLGRFKGITSYSKEVRDGFIFLAVKGAKEDGSKFIPEALKRGARVLVVDAKTKVSFPKGINVIKTKDTRLLAARLALEFYQNPASRLKVVGVTGTCGKTTVTYLLEAILREAGHHPAVIGTINYRFKNEIIPAKNTTPGPCELNNLFFKMSKAGCDYVIMEVSSHALEQKRVAGIKFHSAIFTNLTQDHLDYHKTKENYFKAKAILFKGLKKCAFAVFNRDSEYFLRLKRITKAKFITYGIKNNAQITAEKIHYRIDGTEFVLSFPKGKMPLKINLTGEFNLYNTLAACAWAYQESIPLNKIKEALEKFSFVPGRLEARYSKKGFNVFIDYAHTEDALRNVLFSLRKLCQGRLITVFGCGGERDKLKRPLMGKVASEFSDAVIITSDNPRSEDPLKIIADILKGISKKNYCVISDRRKAIKFALAKAQKNDIIVIAGKGHEPYQIFKDKIIPFDDRKEVERCLKSQN